MTHPQPSIYDQLPTTTRPVRTGANAIEQTAVEVVRREIAAMPASLVVQLALWPDEIAAWAREIRSSESLVYNMLAARKPYSRTRTQLAERFDVSLAVINHLVEARRANPSSRGAAFDGESTPRTPIDWSVTPYPAHRDGTNPIERRALHVVVNDVASMPASTVVGLAMWPDSLTAWSRAERLKSSVVWATLSGSPSAPVRDALARRLGTSLRELDALVRDARATPVSRRVPRPRAEPAPSIDVEPAAVDETQLGLGF